MNEVVYEHERAPRALVERVFLEMAIPADAGLLLWLDGELGRGALTPSDRLRGGFCTAAIGFRDFPEKVWRRIERRPYAIWLSKEEMDGDEVDFTLVLAHELSHLEQHIHDPSLYYAGCLGSEYLTWLSVSLGRALENKAPVSERVRHRLNRQGRS